MDRGEAMIRTDETNRATAEACSFCGKQRRGRGVNGEPIGCRVLIQSELARAVAICPECVVVAGRVLEGVA